MPIDLPALGSAVRKVVPASAPLHAPEIRGNEWAYVKECLDTEWVSTVGSYVTKFEEMLCETTGAAHAVATNTGTSALHAALLVCGVRADDEVVIPNLTFVATGNAVAYCGAVPHFADSEMTSLGLDAAKLDKHLAAIATTRDGGIINRQTGRRITAVVCMHTFGHPVDLDALLAVCAKYELPLIEDAAESLGSYYKDRHTGIDGVVSALSFNGNKIVTTGGGGAVLTSDAGMAARARHLTTTAKRPHAWEFDHDEVGFNYRLPNVNAAIGCAQLERLDNFIARKRAIAQSYAEAFSDVPGISFVMEPVHCRSNYWLNVILLDDVSAGARDDVLRYLNGIGVMARPAWRPLSMLSMFKTAPRMDLTVSQDLYARLINIPSSPRLADV